MQALILRTTELFPSQQNFNPKDRNKAHMGKQWVTRHIMGTIFALFVELTLIFVQHHLCYNQAISSTEITTQQQKKAKYFLVCNTPVRNNMHLPETEMSAAWVKISG